MPSIYSGRKRSYDEAFIRPSFTSSKRRKVSGQSLTLYRRMAPLRTGFWGPQSRSLREYKFLDTNISVIPYAANSTLTLINGITQGTDYNQRIGRQIKMMNYFIRLTVAPQDSTTEIGSYRILLVYDLQSNGVAPTPTEILVSNTTTSHINLDNRERFRVLMDISKTIGGYNTSTGQAAVPGSVYIKRFKKIPLDVQYSGTTDTIGSIASGSLYLLCIASTPVNQSISVQGNIRIRFTDS